MKKILTMISNTVFVVLAINILDITTEVIATTRNSNQETREQNNNDLENLELEPETLNEFLKSLQTHIKLQDLQSIQDNIEQFSKENKINLKHIVNSTDATQFFRILNSISTDIEKLIKGLRNLESEEILETFNELGFSSPLYRLYTFSSYISDKKLQNAIDIVRNSRMISSEKSKYINFFELVSSLKINLEKLTGTNPILVFQLEQTPHIDEAYTISNRRTMELESELLRKYNQNSQNNQDEDDEPNNSYLSTKKENNLIQNTNEDERSTNLDNYNQKNNSSSKNSDNDSEQKNSSSYQNSSNESEENDEKGLEHNNSISSNYETNQNDFDKLDNSSEISFDTEQRVNINSINKDEQQENLNSSIENKPPENNDSDNSSNEKSMEELSSGNISNNNQSDLDNSEHSLNENNTNKSNLNQNNNSDKVDNTSGVSSDIRQETNTNSINKDEQEENSNSSNEDKQLENEFKEDNDSVNSSNEKFTELSNGNTSDNNHTQIQMNQNDTNNSSFENLSNTSELFDEKFTNNLENNNDSHAANQSNAVQNKVNASSQNNDNNEINQIAKDFTSVVNVKELIKVAKSLNDAVDSHKLSPKQENAVKTVSHWILELDKPNDISKKYEYFSKFCSSWNKLVVSRVMISNKPLPNIPKQTQLRINYSFHIDYLESLQNILINLSNETKFIEFKDEFNKLIEQIRMNKNDLGENINEIIQAPSNNMFNVKKVQENRMWISLNDIHNTCKVLVNKISNKVPRLTIGERNLLQKLQDIPTFINKLIHN